MIFILILISLDFYLTLSLSLGLSFFIFLQFLFAAQAWLFFVFFKGTAEQSIRFEKQLRIFAFYSMGALSFLLSFTIFRDLAALVLLAFGKAHYLYGETPSVIILTISTLLFVLGLANAQLRIFTPRVEIKVNDLPSVLAGLKIVQLSDIHLGTGPNVRQITRLVDQALALGPDLIALTGDIIDGNIADLGPELAELSRLRAPEGVYFVLGNHECYWNHREAILAFQKMGITVLQNQGELKKIRGEFVFIAGVNDPAITHAGAGADSGSAANAAPMIPAVPKESRLNLILVHQPGFASKIAEHPYHLQLSGHTHGGQFFPWNLAVKRMHPFHRGLSRIKGLWVYVNMGSGYWGPPVRLGTQCEVTELVVMNATNTHSS